MHCEGYYNEWLNEYDCRYETYIACDDCVFVVGAGTAEDTYDYANHEHHPVVDDLAEALGYFFDETQLPYHWHRVFETA